MSPVPVNVVVLADVASQTPFKYNFQPLVVLKVTAPQYQVFKDKVVVLTTVFQFPLCPAFSLLDPNNQKACCPVLPPEIILLLVAKLVT